MHVDVQIMLDMPAMQKTEEAHNHNRGLLLR